MAYHQVVSGLFLAVAVLSANKEVQAQVEAVGTPQLRFDGDAVRIAMPQLGGRSIVQVSIGGHGPYKFFIDTGSGVSVVDTEIAAALDLEVIGGQAVGAPGGGTVDADRVSMPSIVVGDLVIEGATSLALDIAGMTGGVMEGILGIIFGLQLAPDLVGRARLKAEDDPEDNAFQVAHSSHG